MKLCRSSERCFNNLPDQTPTRRTKTQPWVEHNGLHTRFHSTGFGEFRHTSLVYRSKLKRKKTNEIVPEMTMAKSSSDVFLRLRGRQTYGGVTKKKRNGEDYDMGRRGNLGKYIKSKGNNYEDSGTGWQKNGSMGELRDWRRKVEEMWQWGPGLLAHINFRCRLCLKYRYIWMLCRVAPGTQIVEPEN